MHKPVKVVIKDVSWTFEVLDDKAYEFKHGKDSHGITISSSQAVYLKLSDFSQNLVRHELLHVYISSCCVSSVQDLESSDMEEICAEVIEHHLEDIVKHSKSIYNKLRTQVNKRQHDE